MLRCAAPPRVTWCFFQGKGRQRALPLRCAQILRPSVTPTRPHQVPESLSAPLTVGPSLVTPLPQLTIPYCTVMRAVQCKSNAASFVSSGRPPGAGTKCVGFALSAHPLLPLMWIQEFGTSADSKVGLIASKGNSTRTSVVILIIWALGERSPFRRENGRPMEVRRFWASLHE